MRINKIKDLPELQILVSKHKKKNKSVGLITGCFDILHIGHIELFESAKEEVDILIVGLENDETIKKLKGESRPANNLNDRLRFLESIQHVDYVFPLIETIDHANKKEATRIKNSILQTINPDYLITTKNADRHWQEKAKRLKKLKIKLLDIYGEKIHSTTKIIGHILSEM